jgi:hypothetical protein
MHRCGLTASARLSTCFQCRNSERIWIIYFWIIGLHKMFSVEFNPSSCLFSIIFHLIQQAITSFIKNQWQTGIAYSVQRLATGSTVRGWSPGEGATFRTRPDRPRGPPTLLYNGYLIAFPGVKWPRHGADHPAHSSAEFKGRVELYTSTPRLRPHDTLQDELYFYNFNFIQISSPHKTLDYDINARFIQAFLNFCFKYVYGPKV